MLKVEDILEDVTAIEIYSFVYIHECVLNLTMTIIFISKLIPENYYIPLLYYWYDLRNGSS